MAEESCPAEETLPTPACPGTRMPSQSLALDVSSRSVTIGVVTGDNFVTPRMQSPALQYISNRSVGGSEFLIAQEDVVQCLAACKSRRNLAARLANKLFTTVEKLGSNCRGACGKTALNYVPQGASNLRDLLQTLSTGSARNGCHSREGDANTI